MGLRHLQERLVNQTVQNAKIEHVQEPLDKPRQVPAILGNLLVNGMEKLVALINQLVALLLVLLLLKQEMILKRKTFVNPLRRVDLENVN
jgi:hypothetical protein